MFVKRGGSVVVRLFCLFDFNVMCVSWTTYFGCVRSKLVALLWYVSLPAFLCHFPCGWEISCSYIVFLKADPIHVLLVIDRVFSVQCSIVIALIGY